MSEEVYPFLYSVASSALLKLYQCNDPQEFGGDSNELENVKCFLINLPSIVNSARTKYSGIYDCIFRFHSSLTDRTTDSRPSLSNLYWRLAGIAKTEDVGGHAESSKSKLPKRDLLSSLSFALPKSDDFEADQLPRHLIPCVAYCGLYPEDHRIVRETLVNQWMAEGFLELQTSSTSSRGDTELELEDIGDCYFMELLSRGVFIDPLYRFGANQQALTVYSCKMHPTVHQLATDVIRSEASITSPMGEGLKEKNAMYVAVHQRSPIPPERLHQESSVPPESLNDDGITASNDETRTCMLFLPQIRSCSFIRGSFGRAQLLDFAGTKFEYPPEKLKWSTELRYLSFARNTKLKSIDIYRRLQTLAVDGCVELKMRNNLERAPFLRHLYFTSIEPTLEIPTSTLRILQLSQCLNLRLFSLCDGENFGLLKRLRIMDCPSLKSLLETIDQLPCVEELVIHNCARLDLSNCSWWNSLPRLHLMELTGLPKMTELPAGLQAKALHYLMIADCISLRSMEKGLKNLLALETLCVYDCPSLSMAPNDIQSLTNLHSLDIRKCQKVTPFTSKNLEIIFDGQKFSTGNDDLPEEKDAVPISQMSSLQRKFPYFLLNMEKNIKSSQGILDEKYKTKTPYRLVILVLAMRVMVRIRVRQEQRLFFCCLFPSNFEFDKDKLIQLWMARGLIREPAEHLGKRFDHLMAKGYFLNSRTDRLTGISWYKINAEIDPTLLDRIKNKDRYALIDGQNAGLDKASTSWHHVSIASNNIDKAVFNTLEKLGELDTVLFIRDYGLFLKQIPPTFFESLPWIHTLDLSGSHISELPCSIGRMTQLCFLDLSFTLIERLPETISLLKDLQTLRLIGCHHLHKLPKGMKELVNLYYLEFDVLGQLSCMPKGLGSLTKLRTLSAFIISGEKGCGFTELKDMNNLGGSLCISGLEFADDFEYMEPSEGILKAKTHLTRLHLKWNGSICYQRDDKFRASSALEKLQPPVSLVELQISYYPALNFGYMFLLRAWTLEKLTSITLLKCEIKELRDLGRLPELLHLAIFDLNRVKLIKFESSNYMKLETLVIDGMRRLERLTMDPFRASPPPLRDMRIRHCPNLLRVPFVYQANSLKYLEIIYCKKFEALPPRRLPDSLETLMINRCPNLKTRCSQGGPDWENVQHVENIWIDMKDIRSPPEDDTDTVSEEEDDDYNDSEEEDDDYNDSD